LVAVTWLSPFPSAFLQHDTNLHVKRWKRAHDEIGLGHLPQGRFKSFPIQSTAAD